MLLSALSTMKNRISIGFFVIHLELRRLYLSSVRTRLQFIFQGYLASSF